MFHFTQSNVYILLEIYITVVLNQRTTSPFLYFQKGIKYQISRSKLQKYSKKLLFYNTNLDLDKSGVNNILKYSKKRVCTKMTEKHWDRHSYKE